MSELATFLFIAAILWLHYLTMGGPVAEPHIDRWQDWKDTAESCGLRVTGGTSKAYLQLTAEAGPMRVRIETFGNERMDTRIVVEAPVSPDFEKVKILPQASRAAEEIRIGDAGFDDAFSIEGPTLQLFALLDSETRRCMRAAGRMEIVPGRIKAVTSQSNVFNLLPSLIEISKRLGAPADLPRSLIENVKRDFDGGVRLQNLLLLLREFPGDPGTAEALRAASSDASPAIRMRAARELGPEGRDILLALARRLEDDAVSAEAVSILDRELPLEQAKTILDRATMTNTPRTARACLELLGRGGTAGESLLIETLQHEEADIQVAAARALGRTGSAAAVLPLKEAAERSGRDLGLGQASRQAIAEIQSRAEGASPGQLSLAGTETGQLSLAQAEGQLSLTEKP
jgi:hypothetical protein